MPLMDKNLRISSCSSQFRVLGTIMLDISISGRYYNSPISIDISAFSGIQNLHSVIIGNIYIYPIFFRLFHEPVCVLGTVCRLNYIFCVNETHGALLFD